MAGLPLDLPARSVKPREQGITHLMDRGLSLAEVDGLMEVAGDVGRHRQARLRHGAGDRRTSSRSSRATASTTCRSSSAGRSPSWPSSRAASTSSSQWIRDLGLEHIEVSDGTIEFDPAEKQALIARLADEGFTVLSEVGSKDNDEDHGPVPLGRAHQGRARGRRVEGHLRGARDRHRGHRARPTASCARA